MSGDRPNVVVFVIDDMGWKDAEYMGSEYYETPNIDGLAAEGMTFTDAYSNGPNCAPSRACMMTGQYTPRHGIYTVGTAERGRTNERQLVPPSNTTTLPRENTTIAEVLSEAGYATGFFGKWHLGSGPEHGPEGRGFDVNVAGNETGHPDTYFSPYGNPDIEDGPPGEYLTDRLTEETIGFIEDHREEPFFACLSHYAVHTPLQAKAALREKYRNKAGSDGHNLPTYAAMIESTDESVGRVLATLEELDIADDTIVLFWSDNGGLGGYEENSVLGLEITSQSPLRGGKGMLYEGGIRVPMIVRWPGAIDAGATCEEPVIGSDLFPTIAAVADASVPEDHVVDGESLLPLLRGEGSLDREAIHWHFPAYLEGDQGTWRTTPAAAVRVHDWKLLEFFEEDRVELYDLDTDIEESHDLADERPERVTELRNRMRAWREKLDAPVPTEPNPDYDPESSFLS